jgi:CheY-like chemotaxis protein
MAAETLLLVEDNDITREGSAVVLRRAGYNVVAVSDGQAALEYLRNPPPPDLIVLDMMLPATGFDGWRVLARRPLVPALAAIPVVITTALSIACDEWASALGASGLVKKPFDPDELLAEVRRCLAAAAPTVTPSASRLPAVPTTPARERVLVVEDQRMSRETLHLLLELNGFQVEDAEDGAEGVQKALCWQPDVAVVDIGLPVLDGYEVARQVKKALGGHIRLVALTAYGSDADRQKAFAAGFDAHLTKPADIVELCHQLRSV